MDTSRITIPGANIASTSCTLIMSGNTTMGPNDPTLRSTRNSSTSTNEGTIIPPTTPGGDEKKQHHFAFDGNAQSEDGVFESNGAVIERKSKGVVEMESLKERVNVKFLCILYGFFALLAYVLSLSESPRSVVFITGVG